MKTLFLLLCVAVLAPLQAQTTYPVQITDNGFIFVRVTLNDSIPATFLLDTGAGINVVSSSLYRRVQSGSVPCGIYTGFRHNGERLDGELYKLPSLQLGTLRQSNAVFSVYPPLDGYGIEGILSMKFFQEQPFTIDFKGKTITLGGATVADTPAIIIPLTLHDDRNIALDLFATIRVNDKVDIEVEFDTGSGFETLLINPWFMAKLGLDTTGMPVKYSSESSTGIKSRIYESRMRSVSFSSAPSIEQRDVAVVFKEGLIYEGLMGSGMFREKRLTIDIPHRRIVVR